MRVPHETHELTRSGTPFRRAENLVQIRAWFDHYLVAGCATCRRCPGTGPGNSQGPGSMRPRCIIAG